jgi:hypothetical protein
LGFPAALVFIAILMARNPASVWRIRPPGKEKKRVKKEKLKVGFPPVV